MNRTFVLFLVGAAAALALLSQPAAAGHLAELGIELVETPGGAGRLVGQARSVGPVPPKDSLPDGRPGRGRGSISAAWLTRPTTRYGHGVLGDAVEAGGLVIRKRLGGRLEYVLPENSVFEDLEPRLADLDGDGQDEVIVVRSYLDRGAALAVLGVVGIRLEILAETPAIGQPNRWLNPVGAGDFDGDGRVEVAYVKTPHIGGILRIWRLENGILRELGSRGGFSNHAIGSAALGLSAILDVDGDGAADILLPENGRRSLRIISFAGGEFRDLALLRHTSRIATDFRVSDRNGNRRPDVAYGLDDGTLIELLR